jgi:hypothetical protein
MRLCSWEKQIIPAVPTWCIWEKQGTLLLLFLPQSHRLWNSPRRDRRAFRETAVSPKQKLLLVRVGQEGEEKSPLIVAVLTSIVDEVVICKTIGCEALLPTRGMMLHPADAMFSR